MPIKQWALDDRPREKLLTKGPEALSNSELIAILIQTGGKNRSAIDIAKEVLDLGKNDLAKLGRLSSRDLMVVKGMGQTKAVVLAAALELGRRRQSVRLSPEEKIKGSKDVVKMLQPLLIDRKSVV